MKVFLDTSGIYSFLDGSDRFHESAVEIMQSLRGGGAGLVSHEYIFVESAALVQNRLGQDALRDFYREFWPRVDCVEVTVDQRNRAMEFCIGRQSQGVSFVDSVSFLILDQLGIENVFGFDDDFEKEGYSVVGKTV